MIIDAIDLLKKDCRKLRVKITEKLRKKLFFNLNNSTESLARSLKINEVSLRRKLFNKRGYSLKFDELLFLAQRAKVNERDVLSNITDIKMGANAYWSNSPMKILIDEKFIEGVGYYIGDGRSKTNSGLSAISIDIDTIKFFLNWLIKYFNAEIKNIRINILLPRSNFNEGAEKRKWAKLLEADINSVNRKYKYKSFHKIAVEVNYSRTITKLVLDKLIPIVKEKCLTNKSFAMAYIRGIMTAEGSPRYSAKSHHRSIYLKMKNKTEVKYVSRLLRLLGLTPSFLFSKQDNNWLTIVSGYNELKGLDEMDVFKLNHRKRKKLRKILSNYHHQQAKKGRVREFYLFKLSELEKKYGKYCTAKQLSEYIKRDKTRVINVLRKLQRGGLLRGERIMKVGTPFKFTLTQAGKEFILKKPLVTYPLY